MVYGGTAVQLLQETHVAQSILVVNPAEETREVFRAVCEQRGLCLLEASESGRGLQMARELRPDVIVLDLKSDTAETDQVSDDYEAHAHREQIPLVVLGKARRGPIGTTPSEYVAKPYHYGPLIRRIEELIA